MPLATAQEKIPSFAKKNSKNSYDLGLGKNPPFTGQSRIDHVMLSRTMDEATKYLVEHQATRQYPAPQEPALATLSEIQTHLTCRQLVKNRPKNHHQFATMVFPDISNEILTLLCQRNLHRSHCQHPNFSDDWTTALPSWTTVLVAKEGL
jgi:hypothetical protein